MHLHRSVCEKCVLSEYVFKLVFAIHTNFLVALSPPSTPIKTASKTPFVEEWGDVITNNNEKIVVDVTSEKIIEKDYQDKRKCETTLVNSSELSSADSPPEECNEKVITSSYNSIICTEIPTANDVPNENVKVECSLQNVENVDTENVALDTVKKNELNTLKPDADDTGKLHKILFCRNNYDKLQG